MKGQGSDENTCQLPGGTALAKHKLNERKLGAGSLVKATYLSAKRRFLGLQDPKAKGSPFGANVDQTLGAITKPGPKGNQKLGFGPLSFSWCAPVLFGKILLPENTPSRLTIRGPRTPKVIALGR